MAALLAGPCWEPGRAGKTRRLLSAFPLLALSLCACAVAGTALLAAPFAAVADSALHALPLAAAGTLLCLAAGIPAALRRPGLFWMLIAWLAVSVGAAGWSLIEVPQSPLTRAVRTAVSLLPFMVLGLAAAISASPGGLSRAAAAAGAGPLTTARLLAQAAWPGVLQSLLDPRPRPRCAR